MLCADQHPDYRSIARFRRRHLDALAELFVQALRLCKEAGLVKLGTLALDGTKLRASASRHKAMSYERMTKAEAELEAMRATAAELLEGAEATDQAEDERYGPDRRGDELPSELTRRGEPPGADPRGEGGAGGPARARPPRRSRSGRAQAQKCISGWLHPGDSRA